MVRDAYPTKAYNNRKPEFLKCTYYAGLPDSDYYRTRLSYDFLLIKQVAAMNTQSRKQHAAIHFQPLKVSALNKIKYS